MIRVLLSALVFLFPVGAYCLVLGRVNRRRHPVVVPGVQDCAGLLLALSGFFLFVCPSVLTGFNYRPRDIWLYNHYSSLSGLGHRWWWAWWAFLWFVYLTAVLGGAGLLLLRRRRVTAVYNVEPEAFERALAGVLTRLGLDWARSGRAFFIGFRKPPIEAALPDTRGGQPFTDADAAPDPAPDGRYHDPLLTVEAWPALRHVTVHWDPAADFLRRDIEPALTQALAEVRTRRHPVGTWLATVSAFLFVLMFFLTLLFQLLNLSGVRVGL